MASSREIVTEYVEDYPHAHLAQSKWRSWMQVLSALLRKRQRANKTDPCIASPTSNVVDYRRVDDVSAIWHRRIA